MSDCGAGVLPIMMRTALRARLAGMDGSGCAGKGAVMVRPRRIDVRAHMVRVYWERCGGGADLECFSAVWTERRKTWMTVWRSLDGHSFVRPLWGSLSMEMERFMPGYERRDERTAMEHRLLAVAQALDRAHGINPYTGCVL